MTPRDGAPELSMAGVRTAERLIDELRLEHGSHTVDLVVGDAMPPPGFVIRCAPGLDDLVVAIRERMVELEVAAHLHSSAVAGDDEVLACAWKIRKAVNALLMELLRRPREHGE